MELGCAALFIKLPSTLRPVDILHGEGNGMFRPNCTFFVYLLSMYLFFYLRQFSVLAPLLTIIIRTPSKSYTTHTQLNTSLPGHNPFSSLPEHMTRPAIVPFVFLYRLTQHAQPRDLLPTFVTWLVLGGHADIHSSQENGRGGSFWTRTAGVEQYEPDCLL